MTRQEVMGVRDLDFSAWVRRNLPDSKTGFMVSDLDFVLENWKTKQLMLVEIKTRNKPMARWQNMLFQKLAAWIAKGIDDDWTFHGFHVVTFENTWFNDGRVWVDGKPTTEEDLRKFLAMGEETPVQQTEIPF